MKSRLITILVLIITPCLLLMSFDNSCDKIKDGRYRVHFQTEGFEDYELIVAKDQYTKILKNGSFEIGKLEWREDCILILIDQSGLKKDSLVEKIEEGLGIPCMRLLRKKRKTIYFRTTRTANLNILINEGKLTRLK